MFKARLGRTTWRAATLGSHQAGRETIPYLVSLIHHLSASQVSPRLFHSQIQTFPVLTFQVKTKLLIDWPFLGQSEGNRNRLQGSISFSYTSKCLFRMEIIIFIMEEWCQDLKARKHEKYGYRAKEHFPNTSFWLHQLFLLPLLLLWGINIPFLFKSWISRRFVYLCMSFQEQWKSTAEDNKQSYLFPFDVQYNTVFLVSCVFKI